MLALFQDPLPVGSEAPPFLLPDEEGNVFVLNLNRSKNVLLVFYPADETPGCTAQLCALRDDYERLKEHNIQPVGINPGNAESHKQFKAHHKYPFPLLVDNGKRVAKMYKCAGLIVRRTVYLIGRDGKIKLAQRGKPSVREILAALPAEAK
jgi:peroxiredoxin Q/BCP